MNRFKNLDKKASANDTGTDLKTQHQNTILYVDINFLNFILLNQNNNMTQGLAKVFINYFDTLSIL